MSQPLRGSVPVVLDASAAVDLLLRRSSYEVILREIRAASPYIYVPEHFDL